MNFTNLFFSPKDFMRRAAFVCCCALGSIVTDQAVANGQSMQVTLPNGYPNLTAYDLKVRTSVGEVRWVRVWNGQEWKFNPQWESLSQSWKNLTGTQTADTTPGTIVPQSEGGYSPGAASAGGGGPAGCWIVVDENWEPAATQNSSESPEDGSPVIEKLGLIPQRSTPFNTVMGEMEAPMRVSVDTAVACGGAGVVISYVDVEGLRRINELYLGVDGRYSFNNRSIIEKRPVRQLATGSAVALYASLTTGKFNPVPVLSPKGYRWMDRGGGWIDYNIQGQMVAWGDKNNNVVWLVRDEIGRVVGVVDGSGQVVFSLHYANNLLVEVRDYPAHSADRPSRKVRYQYDEKSRLSWMMDARGKVTLYNYDAGNHVVKITDPEGRVERFGYNGDVVKRRTAPDGGVTNYTFDYDDVNKQFNSKIVRPETPAGRRTEEYTHNRVGKLVRSIINGRVDEEVRYDTGTSTDIRTNARGFSTRITRNEFEQITEVQAEDGSIQKMRYSAAHLGMTELVDEMGVRTLQEFDAKGNLLKSVEAAGLPEERTTLYEVNAAGQVLKMTRKGGVSSSGELTPDAVWVASYDELGLPRKIIDPKGSEYQFVFDRASNLIAYTDPLGNTTRYETDEMGNLLKLTDPLGRVRSYQYDQVGNQVSATDARGKTVRMAYDAMNRLVQATNPVGGVRRLQYSAEDLPLSETDEDGRTRRTEFDNFMRLTKLVDALGNTTEFGYNISDGSNAGMLGSLSRPTEIKYPSFTERIRVDARERPASQARLNPTLQGTQILNQSIEYDKKGRVIRFVRGDGASVRVSYNAFGQITELLDALGGRTQARYDSRGNLIQFIDALNQVTSFEYDLNNKVTQETLPLGQRTRYRWNAAGLLVERLDPKGVKTRWDYDAGQRVVLQEQTGSDGSLRQRTTLSWDAEDKLIAWMDEDLARGQSARAALSYDDAGRKIGERITYPDGSSLGYQYAYSLAGKKTQLTWPDGTVIGYEYSAHGELQSVQIPGEGALSINAYAWTAPKTVLFPGGGVEERRLDGLLKLESLAVKTPNQQSTLSLSNQYDNRQLLSRRVRTDMAGSSTTRIESFTHDVEERLVRVESDTGGLLGGDTETFTLDAVANRTAHSKVSGPWQYDANNRLLQRGTSASSYRYDDAGNLVEKTEAGQRLTRYRYDLQNRLIEIALSLNGGAEKVLARYGYDPQSRRLWKEQYHDKTGQALPQPRRTLYVYADEGLIGEAEQSLSLAEDGSIAAASTPHIITQYGPRPDGMFGTGMLFIKARNSNGEDVFAYYHHDHLGTPIQATDKAGRIVWAASYEAFGRATITTPEATPAAPVLNSNLRLPGQYEDEESGLYYNWNRYYDPQVGRYISADPMGLMGGVNVYAYVGGDPVDGADPSGLYVNHSHPYNTESYEATGAKVCEYADSFDPWTKARVERDKNPFDLNARNAEHYYYAQYLRAQGGGGFWGGIWGTGGVIVHQSWKIIRAIPIIPLPTTPPTWQSFAWGITGAWNSRKPNCGCGK